MLPPSANVADPKQSAGPWQLLQSVRPGRAPQLPCVDDEQNWFSGHPSLTRQKPDLHWPFWHAFFGEQSPSRRQPGLHCNAASCRPCRARTAVDGAAAPPAMHLFEVMSQNVPPGQSRFDVHAAIDWQNPRPLQKLPALQPALLVQRHAPVTAREAARGRTRRRRGRCSAGSSGLSCSRSGSTSCRRRRRRAPSRVLVVRRQHSFRRADAVLLVGVVAVSKGQASPWVKNGQHWSDAQTQADRFGSNSKPFGQQLSAAHWQAPASGAKL